MIKLLQRPLPFYINFLFATCVLVLVGNTISTMQNLQSLKTTNALIDQSWQVNDRLQYLNVLVMDAESSTRGYFLSGDTVYLGSLKTAKEQVSTELNGLELLLKGNKSQLQNLVQLRVLIESKINILDQAKTTFQNKGKDELTKLAKVGEGRAAMDDIRLLVIIMQREQNELQTTRKVSFYDDYREAVRIGTATNAVTILILILFYSLIYRNVTKRLRTEVELITTNATLESTVQTRTEQLSVLSHHLLNVAEEEKKRLARELHDELGSSLTAIGMDMSAVAHHLRQTESPLIKSIDRARKTLLETIDLKRRIVENLRPSVLDNLGLSISIRQHCEQFQQITGVKCEVNIAADFDRIDPSRSIAFFRIAQESLNNVSKYAEAKHVWVNLTKESSGVRLQIIDDGIGISSDVLTKPKSYGLTGMRERATLLHGTFFIRRGNNDRGTWIEAFIPEQGTQI